MASTCPIQGVGSCQSMHWPRQHVRYCTNFDYIDYMLLCPQQPAAGRLLRRMMVIVRAPSMLLRIGVRQLPRSACATAGCGGPALVADEGSEEPQGLPRIADWTRELAGSAGLCFACRRVVFLPSAFCRPLGMVRLSDFTLVNFCRCSQCSEVSACSPKVQRARVR